MRTKVLFFCTMLLLVVSVFVFTQSTANAAPLGICVSAGTGNWNSAGSWVCYGVAGNLYPDDATKDAYILSGHTITVDSAAIAGNVTVEGTLNGGSANLDINGNLTNNGTFTANTGTVTFSGVSAQSIGGSGALTFNNLSISNATNLNKDITVNGTLTLTAADLNAGSNTLNLVTAATVLGTATVAGTGDVIGNVTRTGSFSTTPNYQFNSQYTLINFSSITTAPSSITINLAKTAPGGLAIAVPRTYNISEGSAYVVVATLQLHYKTSEGGFTLEANLRPWRQIAGRWTLQTGSVTAAGDASYVSATGVTNFSNWAISDNGAPTAVILSSFKTSASSFDLSTWLTGLFNR